MFGATSGGESLLDIIAPGVLGISFLCFALLAPSRRPDGSPPANAIERRAGTVQVVAFLVAGVCFLVAGVLGIVDDERISGTVKVLAGAFALAASARARPRRGP